MARRPKTAPLFLLLVSALLIAGLGLWFWRHVAPPRAGTLMLTPVAFADLPGWHQNDQRFAMAAFRRSCEVLARAPATRSIWGAGYWGLRTDWQSVCARLPADGANAAATQIYFETWFTPVAISSASGQDALFTGYYEPELHASRNRHGVYATPVYGLPDDLQIADLGLFRSDLAGQRITGRSDGHSFVPYFTRAEIDARGLARARALLYADDPAQLFFLHIQGSGRARLDDGEIVRLAYAGQNGRPYTSIGRVLIAQGAVDREHMSMQAIRAWLKANPKDAQAVMERDASFVFFREAPLGDSSLGSPGSEGVPLTPQASMAVDTKLHPLGAPFFVAATAPDADPSRPDRVFDRLLIAQDTGGAIKGAARADIFWGFGPAAEAIAGRMKATGRLFVLLPKPIAARLAPHTDFSAPQS